MPSYTNLDLVWSVDMDSTWRVGDSPDDQSLPLKRRRLTLFPGKRAEMILWLCFSPAVYWGFCYRFRFGFDFAIFHFAKFKGHAASSCQFTKRKMGKHFHEMFAYN